MKKQELKEKFAGMIESFDAGKGIACIYPDTIVITDTTVMCEGEYSEWDEEKEVWEKSECGFVWEFDSDGNQIDFVCEAA